MKLTLLKTITICSLALVACGPDTTAAPQDTTIQSKLDKGAQALADCRATACKTLTLSAASLDDYSVLNQMDHVTALTLRYNTFEDLDDIAGMDQLVELRIVATKLRDVSGIANFQNLSVLTLQSALADDIRPTLLKMQRLRHIAINLPQDNDISFVRRMPDLKTLALIGRGVSELEPLRQHPSLETLSIRAQMPDNLSPLLDMPKLKTLSVYDATQQKDGAGILGQLTAKGVQVKLIPSILF